MAESMLRIQQVRSTIGRTQDQRATVRSLGLRRIRHTVLQPDRPEIRGMIQAVSHLVTFDVVAPADVEAARAALAKPAAVTAVTPAKKAPAKKAAAKKTTAKKATASTTAASTAEKSED
jgi:large subunit ribosomal protein L30